MIRLIFSFIMHTVCWMFISTIPFLFHCHGKYMQSIY